VNDSAAYYVEMSFGYGVGDIIKVLELANKLRARFVECPQQFKAILNE